MKLIHFWFSFFSYYNPVRVLFAFNPSATAIAPRSPIWLKLILKTKDGMDPSFPPFDLPCFSYLNWLIPISLNLSSSAINAADVASTPIPQNPSQIEPSDGLPPHPLPKFTLKRKKNQLIIPLKLQISNFLCLLHQAFSSSRNLFFISLLLFLFASSNTALRVTGKGIVKQWSHSLATKLTPLIFQPFF